MAAMQHPSPTHTHQPNTTTKQSSTIILEKLKASIIESLTKLQPNNTLSPSQIHSIQLQLQQAFPSFHIPTHPTYSIMIEKAIEELNDEDGSSEEAISEYILANYEGLPWAHKRFLTYYLDKLCKDNEVVCISSNRYSAPRLMDEFSRKKKCQPSEVDNLDGNEENVNVALFQEDGEEAGVLFKCRVKRKRRSSLVVEDDEEEVVGGTVIVERQDDVVENSEVPVNDDGNVSDVRVEAEGKDDTNEEHDIAAGDKVQSVVAVEEGSQSSPSKNLGDEVNAGEGKDEQLVLVSTVDKALPGEHEEDVGTEALLSDHVISDANVMLVPSVSIEKSMNEPMDGSPAVVSVSGGDSPMDTPDKLVLGRKDRDSCVIDLKIVAVEKGSPESAEKREIVCCLHTSQPEQPKMRRKYRPRKKLNLCQEGKPTTSETPSAFPNLTKGAKLVDSEELNESTRTPDMKLDPKLSESSMLESLLQSQQGHMSSAFGSNLMLSVAEGSVEHGKQKLHSDSFPSSHHSELMLMEDGDLYIPLQQVLKVHGKRRKSSLHEDVSKMAENPEDPEKKVPQKVKKTTRHRKKQKLLQCDGQKSCSSEAVVALESEVVQPFQLQGGISTDFGGHDGQTRQNANSTAAATSQKHDVGPPYEMQGERQPGSPQVEATIDTLCFDDQHHELREDEQIKGDCGLFHKPGQYDLNPRESSQAEDKNALKDLKHSTEHHQQQEIPSEPATNLILEEAASMVSSVFLEKIPDEENNGGIANPPLESSSVKSPSPSHHDLEEDLLKQNGSDVQLQVLVPDLAIFVKGKMPHSNQQSAQKEKEVKKRKRRGRPSKNKNENQDAAESVNSHSLKQEGLSDTVSYQQLEEQSKSAFSRSLEASSEDVSASVRLNGRQQGLSVSGIHQESDRITIGEQIDAAKEADFLNLHDQWKEGPLEPATCKTKKKDGRGRPRKIKETTIKDVPAPLDLYVMRQKELAQAVTCQSKNKDGGENSSRQTEPVTHDVGALDLHDWQQAEVPLATNHFLEEKDGQGVPKEHDATREDATVLVNLHPRQKKVPSETTNFQPEGRGKRRKQEVMQCEPATAVDEVAAQSTHDQQQEGPSEQVTSESRTREDMVSALNFQDQQQEKPCEPSTPQGKMNRRPMKQIATTNKDVAANLNLEDQQQEGSSVQATHQMKDGQVKKDGQGSPPKSEVAEKSPLDLDLQQRELPSKSAIHPSPDASNVGQQQNVSCHVDKLPATLEGPISLRTRSKHGVHKPEATETLLGSQADHLGEELVPVLSDKESQQQEVVPKTDQEKKQWQSSSENPGESQAEVHEAPSQLEQVTNISDDVTLLVDQPCKHEERCQNPVQKQGRQLRNHTTVLKQKSHNHIPPSAIRRSSRINQQSQIGSICTKIGPSI